MRYATLTLLLLVALLGACSGDDKDEPSATQPAPTATEPAAAAPGPATFEVIAGAVSDSFDIEQFMPATIHIREGDTVHWTGQLYEGFTVTFSPTGQPLTTFDDYLIPAPDEPGAQEFNPIYALASDAQGSYDGSEFVNSGILGVPGRGAYSLTFPTAGVYSYLCMIHPFIMHGVVAVDAADAQVPEPAAVTAQGEALLQSYIAESEAAASDARAQREADATASGPSVREVSVGLDTPRGQVLSFVPSALEVDAGTRIIFRNSERDFHNVIFAPAGTDPPQFPIIKPVEGKNGFRLIIDPDAEHAIPAPTDASPSNLFSSGLMGIGFPSLLYEITLTQPGTYTYYCTVHTLAGMAGTIEVR